MNKHNCETCGREYTVEWADSIEKMCPRCTDMRWETVDNEAFDCAEGDNE